MESENQRNARLREYLYQELFQRTEQESTICRVGESAAHNQEGLAQGFNAGSDREIVPGAKQIEKYSV